MSRGGRIAIVILFVLVTISLALNAYLIFRLQQAQTRVNAMARQLGPVIEEVIDARIAELDTLSNSSFEVEIAVEEEFPLQLDFPIEEEFAVPINLTVPISRTIETVITIPIAGFDVPVPIEVPVDVTVPIEQEINVPVETTVEISTTVPIALELPMAVNLGETELAPYFDTLQTELGILKEDIIAVLAEIEESTDADLY